MRAVAVAVALAVLPAEAAAQPLPVRPPACTAASPACRVVIDAQPQERARWCVPAAVRAALDLDVPQDDLARRLRTTSRGSFLHRVPRAVAGLTSTAPRFTFGFDSYRDGTDLLDRVRSAVGGGSTPVIMGVDVALLPYWPAGSSGLHAIVVVGWSGDRIVVWDPIDAAWNTGVHIVAADALAHAGSRNGRAMVWPGSP